MRPNDRREKIVDLVRERERVTVDFLAQELSTSCETIRRDLTELSARGHIRKFHGGATLPELSGANLEGSFQARMQEHLREKRAIARGAAALFSPGDTLFIDTGTTTVIFAEELARLSRLTVITNSIAIAQTMARSAGNGNRVFLIGGEYSDDAGENVGTLAIDQIARFHASHAVLTVGAVEPEGILDYDLAETEIASAMVAQSRAVTILADSSKLVRSALFQVCPLTDVDRLVVDRAPGGPIAEALQAAAVEVIVTPTADTVVKIA
jgi:DeoR family glycerol-3-phosphate regulon repressor